MPELLEVTRFIKKEQQENGWMYRALFRYKGQSGYLDFFLTNEYISEMEGIPEFVSEMCLDWAKENYKEAFPNG